MEEKLNSAIDMLLALQSSVAETRAVGRWCNGGIDKLSLVYEIAYFLEIDVFSLLP